LRGQFYQSSVVCQPFSSYCLTVSQPAPFYGQLLFML
jgi:hypothetical protein